MFVVSVVRVLRWIHRAHGNLRALGSETPRFSPDQSVQCWFKPVYNLFEPYLVMRELVQGSDPTRYKAATTPSANDGSERFLRIWWTACLFAIFTFGIGMKMAVATGDVSLEAVLGTEIADTAVIAISGWLTATIIHRVNRHQVERYALVVGGS